jgi:hypothetical protein
MMMMGVLCCAASSSKKPLSSSFSKPLQLICCLLYLAHAVELFSYGCSFSAAISCKFFLVLPLYVLLPHFKLLLLGPVVAYPKVDAEPYERRDGIVFDKTQLVNSHALWML